jgi:hypothetical protein
MDAVVIGFSNALLTVRLIVYSFAVPATTMIGCRTFQRDCRQSKNFARHTGERRYPVQNTMRKATCAVCIKSGFPLSRE